MDRPDILFGDSTAPIVVETLLDMHLKQEFT
jgi:hypothetical protein